MKRLLLGLILALSVIAPLTAYPAEQSASCAIALREIFSNEGGFQKLRNDSGNWTGGKVGKGRLVGTKYGICAATYPKEDIQNLTLPRATRYYERDFWGPLRLSGLKSQGMATTVLDTAVNCGVGTAGVLLDRTRNIITGRGEHAPASPAVDKELVEWINSYTRPRHQRVIFYCVFQALRTERYVAITKRNPAKRQFLSTWLLRTWN